MERIRFYMNAAKITLVPPLLYACSTMPGEAGALGMSVPLSTGCGPFATETTTTREQDSSLEASEPVKVNDIPFLLRKKFTAAQVRRAAGSQSLDKLKEAIVGWTHLELDAMASEDGKNAVHMAAWQGCIDNLKHLIDVVGCHVNSIATGTYSYGKTPIFFAATRCRDDVATFLLERGASVKIVNNKGQSVLSIASSHLTPATVQLIEQAEQDQEHPPWTNYRITHSDGLEYGDLDPRFLDRPLREDDVVTAHAVNPTTKQSRRGSFLRRNPHLLSPPVREENPAEEAGRQAKRSPLKSNVEVISNNQTEQIDEAWRLLQTLHSDSNESGKAFATILKLHDKVRKPWIKEVATKLCGLVSDSDGIDRIVAAAALELNGYDKEDNHTRLRSLLDRVSTQARQQLTLGESALAPARGTTPSPATLRRGRSHPTVPLSSPLWKEACRLVSNLSLRVFMVPPVQVNGDRCYLRISRRPVWVDTIDALERLRDQLASAPLVAFDTEWTDAGHLPGSTVVSTLQLAVDDTSTWIIDLAQGQSEKDEPSHRQYQALCRDVVQSLFEMKILLGFALGRDIVKLEEWLSRPLCLNRCLDLQHYYSRSKQNVPGLATCARQVLVGMTHDQDATLQHAPLKFHLDKSQQCSDWSQRPLSTSQLSYAALDAAILPFLLAEQARMSRSQGDEVSCV